MMFTQCAKGGHPQGPSRALFRTRCCASQLHGAVGCNLLLVAGTAAFEALPFPSESRE